LLAAAVQLQAVRERAYPSPADEADALYVRSPTAIRRMTVAYDGIAADLYWMRALQYYGGTKRRLEGTRAPEPPPAIAAVDTPEYRDLYPLLDITTSLDPHFTIAYRFGAVFLAEAYPGGAGRPDLAVKLLAKGLRVQPDKWEYMEDIGFVYYWYRHDFETASSWFARASEVPRAPWWLRSLAATTLARGGDRESSRTMWEAIRQSAEEDWLRKDAERRLLQLRALDEIDSLQRAVDAYAARTGAPPSTWSQLARANGWRGAPIDPTGTPYELAGGRVGLSTRSTLWPPPDEPAKTGPTGPPS
jgi:hypothetical protein